MALSSLSKGVETIAFADSALPAAMSSEQMQEIVTSLEQMTSAEGRPCACHFFGKKSVCAQISSFLVSRGCPSHLLVEGAFVAAGEHSELGKMLQWFASAVVGLFVDGVKGGVTFPQAWEEAMRERPALAPHTFELQGFAALFSFLLCQLAAVEGTMSKSGASGEVAAAHCVSPRDSRKKLQKRIPRENASGLHNLAQERTAGRALAAASNSDNGAVTKGAAITATTRTTTIRALFAGVGQPTALPQRPAGKTLKMKNVQPLWNPEGATGSFEALKPIVPPPSLQLSTINAAKEEPLANILPPMPIRQQIANSGIIGPDPSEGSLSHYSKWQSENLAQNDVIIPPLAIRSKTTSDKAGDVDAEVDADSGPCTFPGLPNPQGDSLLTEEAPALVRRRRLLSSGRPTPLREEDIQQRMRARELRRKYGVKKIVNYAERDLEDVREQMERMRETLDAECTPSSGAT
ncbi:uncharacterized protein Tco025E_06112 [Trypanosoma conorhini]|uniref:Uncharacterized protein n=1 Tax=Trypanosoma conorhini TaxID=83891 RepID=A0A422P994_9TRYP|nr:uncharacterized protein Tco025E_06112 [Trypanosoma conorhini]RNF14268.1 hypothetical protein Tco025E_06112 [Trypanosoma conorhini]